MKPKNMRYSEWTGEVRPNSRDTNFEKDLGADARYYISRPGKTDDDIFVALISKRVPGEKRVPALDMPPKVGNRGNRRLDRSLFF
jgi:hypothetical protein